MLRIKTNNKSIRMNSFLFQHFSLFQIRCLFGILSLPPFQVYFLFLFSVATIRLFLSCFDEFSITIPLIMNYPLNTWCYYTKWKVSSIHPTYTDKKTFASHNVCVYVPFFNFDQLAARLTCMQLIIYLTGSNGGNSTAQGVIVHKNIL